MTLEIPNYKNLDIKNVVLDYNGTLAGGGVVDGETGKLLEEVCRLYETYVITADTFGTVKEQLREFELEVVILSSADHTVEKAEFIASISAQNTIAFGNGNNDKAMLQAASLGIAVIGEEGCSIETMMAADIAIDDIHSGMRLLIEPARLKATLRR
jgi:soluble P-type ATPase